MQIRTITVSASRKFNHPHEQYSNFGFSVQMTAELCEHDITEGRVEELSAMAEAHAEAHKQQILSDLEIKLEGQMLRVNIKRLENTPQQLEALISNLEKEKALGDLADEYVIKNYERQIKSCEGWQERLDAERAKLAALPRPKLIVCAEIHPGHPDHPATGETEF